MRDITITSKIIKRELLILLACFLAAILINIAAIIAYHTFWIELITQIGYELATVYSSCRVTYIQKTNTWKFYSRNDNGSFADPTTGSFSHVGSAVDDSFVDSKMSCFGFYISSKSYGTATILQIDNYTVRTYDMANEVKPISIEKPYKIRIMHNAIEIETTSAMAMLYDITGSLIKATEISDNGILKVNQKGLYVLSIELPDGTMEVEKIFL